MTLEQSLRDLCTKHGFDSLSIHASDHGRHFYSFAQWVANGERDGVIGTHCDTIAETLTSAIIKANAKRAAVPDVALPDAPIILEADA